MSSKLVMQRVCVQKMRKKHGKIQHDKSHRQQRATVSTLHIIVDIFFQGGLGGYPPGEMQLLSLLTLRPDYRDGS